ncbi:histidine phosphatase family protein [Shouchella patagoniensis]|uniref:histidine phosphatase family protein n=1 Tax=Shouchella patagoniensis TaxID=228576 RepID=UPI00099499A9
MQTILYFIRHADSDFVFGMERERTLSIQGKRDANHLVTLLEKRKRNHFISSPYVRAVQTINPLAIKTNSTITTYETSTNFACSF